MKSSIVIVQNNNIINKERSTELETFPSKKRPLKGGVFLYLKIKD